MRCRWVKKVKVWQSSIGVVSIPMEIWKVVDEFPDYEVSNLGNVRSLKFDKVRMLTTSATIHHRTGKTYMYVSLRKDNKQHTKTVHRLVGKAFIPNPLNLPEIDHINGEGTDNWVENLKWDTRSGNCLNREPWGKSGHKNVCQLPNKTYYVQIRRNRKVMFSKVYKTLEEAIAGRNAFLATLQTST